MRLLAAALLALTCVATTHAQTPPPFTERDRLAAITALAGQVAAGTARDDFGGARRTVQGFLTPDKSTIYVQLLATPFRQAARSHHLIVLAGHHVNAGVIDYRLTTQADIYVGVSAFRNGRWQMTSNAAPLTSTGFNGRDPVAALRKIGADRHALELRSNQWRDGSSVSVVTLHDLRGTQPAELLHVVTDADDCGRSDSCFAFEGAFQILARAGAAAYDATLELTGTYRNATGAFVGIPANAPFVLKLVNGTFTPVLSTPARRALWNAVQSPWVR